MQENTGSIWAFAGVFLLIFFVSATVLYVIDFVPEPPQTNDAAQTATETTNESYEQPLAIRIPKVGVDTKINNPQSNDLEVLDDALLTGAVRYPGSAFLGEDRTMFLFGHQSYLPVVHNQAFKAFNGLQELESGDTISVFSETGEYVYQVTSVTKVRAEDALIPLTAEQNLVLSTCNSFGDPGERYVVQAEFVRYTSHN